MTTATATVTNQHGYTHFVLDGERLPVGEHAVALAQDWLRGGARCFRPLQLVRPDGVLVPVWVKSWRRTVWFASAVGTPQLTVQLP